MSFDDISYPCVMDSYKKCAKESRAMKTNSNRSIETRDASLEIRDKQ